MSRFKEESFKRQFRVLLSEREKVETRERVVNVLDEIEEMEEKEDLRREEASKLIKAKVGQVAGLRMDLRAGKLAEVSCTRKFDFHHGEVTESRDDNGDIFTTRKVTDKDRQMYLPGDDVAK